MLVMTTLLAIIGFIILARPLPIFFTECLGNAFALTHGVLATFVNRARTIKEHFIVNVVAALSTSIYSVNRTIGSASMGLSAS